MGGYYSSVLHEVNMPLSQNKLAALENLEHPDKLQRHLAASYLIENIKIYELPLLADKQIALMVRPQ